MDKLIVIKNKATKNYFIYIEEIDDDKALFVTPLSEIKLLDLHLFEEAEEYDEDYLISHNFLHPHQVKRYHQFLEIAPIEFWLEQVESGMPGMDALIKAHETLTDEQFQHIIETIVEAKKEVDAKKEKDKNNQGN